MAAEVLAQGGAQVDLFDAMPSVGRKFLLAGRGGLNLTHSEDIAPFLARYAERASALAPCIHDFNPTALRAWALSLGVSTFVGSSGRVFPSDMKAAPLLRAWLHRLRAAGVVFHTRHRWLGWTQGGALSFESPAGLSTHRGDATVLALGGASWPQLGSDGAWVPLLQARGVDIAPLQAANCGFDVMGKSAPGWSAYLAEHYAGQPVKPVVASVSDPMGHVRRQQGEFVLTRSGVEGSLIYAFSALLRQTIAQHGQATLTLDLLPSHSAQQVLRETQRPRGRRSLATHLKSRLGLQGLKLALLHEVVGVGAAALQGALQGAPHDALHDPKALATLLKALPVVLCAPRPVAETISSAGGVRFEALDQHMMLRHAPGVFCAGEMLDWEAPTGGYLLTACLATGRAAALGVLQTLPPR